MALKTADWEPSATLEKRFHYARCQFRASEQGGNHDKREEESAVQEIERIGEQQNQSRECQAVFIAVAALPEKGQECANRHIVGAQDRGRTA